MNTLKKRILTVFMVLTIGAFLFSGCTKTQDMTPSANSNEKKTLQIVTSFYPMYIFTKNITEGIEDVSVTNMTEAQTGCLHDYQLSPDNLKLLETADTACK